VAQWGATASVITSGVMGRVDQLAARVLQQAQCLGVMVRPRQPPAGPVELG
jgi:hypothetical protein